MYDFVRGTLDVSVLHVSDSFVDVMDSAGDDELGGSDFDARVASFLAVKYEDCGGQGKPLRRVHEGGDGQGAHAQSGRGGEEGGGEGSVHFG